jgi:hypothetical protein
MAVLAAALAVEGLAASSLNSKSVAGTTARAQETATPAQAKPRRSRGQRRGRGNNPKMMRGVPNGVENCLNHLAQMAAADPLIEYEGHPSEIINNGLLWNDAKSKCSLGDDQDKRKKVFEIANAWRTKDAAKVRSLLQELGASASGSR